MIVENELYYMRSLATVPLFLSVAMVAGAETSYLFTAGKFDIEGVLRTYRKEDEKRRVRKLIELVDDKDSRSGKALRVRLDKKRVRKADFRFLRTPPLHLPVGKYRVTVRMKMTGMLLVLGTPIFVDIGGIRKRVEFRGYQFKEEDSYQEFSFYFDQLEHDYITKRPEVYEKISPFAAGPSLWKQVEAKLEAKRRHERGEFSEKELEERNEAPAKAKLPQISILMGFSKTKRNVKGGEDSPANSIYSVSVDYIRIEKVPEPGIQVREVLADKRWLKPGQETAFRVWLSNHSGEPQSGRLELYLEYALDKRKKIAETQVSLPDRAYAVERFTYKTSREEPVWGYAVVAEFVQQDKLISKARDVFTVHPNNSAVKILGGYGTPSYANHLEVFGCTPGDCALVYIDDPERPYQTGMSGYVTNNRSQKSAVEWNHEIGVATVMYLFPGFTNNWGADLYLQHPEWFLGRLNFSDEAYRINAQSDRLVREAYARNHSQLKQEELNNFHLEGGLNFYDRRLVDYVIDGVISAMKNIGYDGIRWDGGPLPVHEFNSLGERVVKNRDEAMKLSAKYFAYMKRRVKEAGLPHFFNGFNGDSYGYTAIIHSLTAEQKDPNEFPQFAEMMKDGGFLMDESYALAVGYRDPLNIIHNYYRALVQMRTACRRVGGHFEGFPPNWRGRGILTTTDIYWHLLTVMSGAHIPAVYPPLPYSDDGLAHFITRFCEFLWDEGLKPLSEPEKKLEIDSPRQLWYMEAVVQKRVGNRMRYVVPIVNPPPGERFLTFRYGELPEPVLQPFTLKIRRPRGYGGTARAFMLTCEPSTGSIPLKLTGADTVNIEIPELKLFRVIVVEFEK